MGNYEPAVDDTLNKPSENSSVPTTLKLECPWCGSRDNCVARRKLWMRLLSNSKYYLCLNCANHFLVWGSLKKRKKRPFS